MVDRQRDLEGKRVLVTAGPTQEAIDPVRFISNHSTGRMGYAIAEVARDRGARVVLVSGPVSLEAPDGVELVSIVSAQDLFDAVSARYVECDAVVAAAAVAAHECGHAVQHATAYAPLRMRSALVPVVSFASNIMTWVLLGGMLLLHTFPQLLLFGIILFATTTLFSFITLPVEINASQRALVWLSNAGITNAYTHDKAEDALRSAAYTYVVAALGSLATLLYYIMIFLGGRSRD